MKSRPNGRLSIRCEAGNLERKYGELAEEYAAVRSETARYLGDTARARGWDKVIDVLHAEEAVSA
jgi:hypothetical protein